MWKTLVTLCVCFVFMMPTQTSAKKKVAAPYWQQLTTAKAPQDALRTHGNSEPQDGYGDYIWRDVQRKGPKLEKELSEWAGSTSENGIRKQAKLREALKMLNPVVCRARMDNQWIPGRLDQEKGVCVLYMLRKDAKKRSCYGEDGPECRYHVPVLGAKVFVLRGASSMSLWGIKRKQAEMTLPYSALVGMEEGVFKTKAPFCRSGNTRGILMKDGPNLICDTHGIERTSSDSRLLGYGDAKLFMALELEPVVAYLKGNRKILRAVVGSAKGIKTIEDGNKRLATLKEATMKFHGGLQPVVAKIDKSAHGEAAKRVQEMAGELLAAAEADMATIQARIQELEVDAEVAEFQAEFLDPLLKMASDVAKQKKRPPGDLEEAAAEISAIETWLKKVSQLKGTAEDELSDPAQGRVDKVFAPKFKSASAIVKTRQALVDAYIKLETAKAEMTELAESTQALIDKANAHTEEGKAAYAMVEALEEGRTKLLAAMTAKITEPALEKHRQRSLPALRPLLSGATEKVEPLLPAKRRLERLELIYERMEKETDDVGSVSVGLAHLMRLLKTADEARIQADMIRALSSLRQRVVTGVAELVDEGFQCEVWGEEACGTGLDQDRASQLMKTLYMLPKKVKKKAKKKEGKALAKALKESGFLWEWPDGPSETGDTFDGPWLIFDAKWMHGKLAKTLAPEVAAWLACREGQLVDYNVDMPKYFKACNTTISKYPQSPLAADIKEAVLGEVEKIDQRYDFSYKTCAAIHRKHKKAFFGAPLEAKCKAQKEKESREKAIAKILKKIQSDIKSKKYSRARGRIQKLADAGAEKWQVESSARGIDNAERYESDRKARAAAEKRAKALMRKVPSFEATCKAKQKTFNYAVKMIRKSAARGQPSKVRSYEKQKDAAGRKACDAQAKVYEVYHLYKSQGNDTAANAVLEAARTCHRNWNCR